MTKSKPDAMQEAFRLLEPVLAEPQKYPDRLILLPAGSPVLSKIFSKEPTRIIQYLRERGPVSSIAELAKQLDRDPAAVSRDIHVLERHGLVVATTVGRGKRLSAADRPVLVA